MMLYAESAIFILGAYFNCCLPNKSTRMWQYFSTTGPGHSTKISLRPTFKVVVACRPFFLPIFVCSHIAEGYLADG